MATCADSYESEGRLFESAWAHPRKPSDSLTRAPSVPPRQPAFSVTPAYQSSRLLTWRRLGLSGIRRALGKHALLGRDWQSAGEPVEHAL